VRSVRLVGSAFRRTVSGTRPALFALRPSSDISRRGRSRERREFRGDGVDRLIRFRAGALEVVQNDGERQVLATACSDVSRERADVRHGAGLGADVPLRRRRAHPVLQRSVHTGKRKRDHPRRRGIGVVHPLQDVDQRVGRNHVAARQPGSIDNLLTIWHQAPRRQLLTHVLDRRIVGRHVARRVQPEDRLPVQIDAVLEQRPDQIGKRRRAVRVQHPHRTTVEGNGKIVDVLGLSADADTGFDQSITEGAGEPQRWIAHRDGQFRRRGGDGNRSGDGERRIAETVMDQPSAQSGTSGIADTNATPFLNQNGKTFVSLSMPQGVVQNPSGVLAVIEVEALVDGQPEVTFERDVMNMLTADGKNFAVKF